MKTKKKAVWQERKEPILVMWLRKAAAAEGYVDTKKSKGYQVSNCIEESCFHAEENQTINPSEHLSAKGVSDSWRQSPVILPAIATGFRNWFSLS